MNSLEQAINSVASDSTSGSLGLVQQLCAAIEKSNAPFLSKNEKKALQHFSAAKRQFAVVNHLVAFLLDYEGQELQTVVKQYQGEWAKIVQRLTQKAVSRIEPARRLLVHSHSEMIVNYLHFAGGTRPNLEIWQTESLPDKEGEVQARRLTEIGLHVHLVPDYPDQQVFHEIDAFICGADAISTRSFINKTGTKLLAIKSREAGKEFFVLADPRKRIVNTRHYQSMLDSMDSLFEEIPSDLVSEFIVEP